MVRWKEVGKRILNGIQNAEVFICLVGIIITTLMISFQVINRYLLHFEIMWLNDLALYIFVIFMFLAAAVTTWNEGHVAVDIFRNRLTKNKPVASALYKIFLNVLTLVILGVYLPVAYQFMARAIKYPEYGTLVRWFNTSWLQILLFVALVLIVMHLLVILRKDLRTLRKAVRTPSQGE
jgi:C4-dicarboxylate transporter, DctQ subunit